MQNKLDKVRLLIDLKPVLDGYAGIPQEARLLFCGLRTMGEFEVDGLIQHGGRKIRKALRMSRSGDWSMAKRVNRLSRVIVSLYENPYSNFWDSVVNAIDHHMAVHLMRLRAILRRPEKLSVFESELFDDFVWRTFFSKTLKPESKALVTAARYRILDSPRKLHHKTGLSWLKIAMPPIYPIIDTRGYHIFIAQMPVPIRVSSGTQMVVRYHDSVPLIMPHTIQDKAFQQASYFYSLRENVKSGAWFSCVSEASRADLVKIFPETEARSSVIHNIVSSDYFEEDSAKELVFQIIRNRLSPADGYHTNLKHIPASDDHDRISQFDYLLMVSTIEPRKNHQLLLEAWERLKYTCLPNLKLVLVGHWGWGQHSSKVSRARGRRDPIDQRQWHYTDPLYQAFRPWAERGHLFHLVNVPASELRVLYKHAAATICPSFSEGFGYSGAEALKSGGLVIASDLPVHHEIYGEGAAYFDPYSPENAAEVIRKVIADDGAPRREELRRAGMAVADRYTPEKILPQWESHLNRLAQGC